MEKVPGSLGSDQGRASETVPNVFGNDLTGGGAGGKALELPG
jgi:hypothetical protein